MKRILAIFSLFSLVSSCTPENKNNDDAALALLAVAATNPQTLNLEFEVTANGQTFESNRALTVNGVSNVTFRDLRFFVSEITLVRADGSMTLATLNDDGVWQTKNVALLDFENGKSVTGSHGGTSAGMNSKVTGSVAPGSYTEIQFTIGVPEDLNHLLINDSKAPLNIGAMYWAWASGYKHAKIEFTKENATTTTKWTNMHLGSTGFGASPAATACRNDIVNGVFGNCPAKFRPRIRLVGNLNLGNQKIRMNLDKLLSGYTHVDAANPDNWGTCMPLQPSGTPDPDFRRCNPLLTNLGLNGRVSNATSALNQTDLDAGVGSVNTSFQQEVFSLGN